MFKVVVLATIFAVASAGYLAPAPLAAAPGPIVGAQFGAPLLRAPIAAAPILRAAPIAKAVAVAEADYDPNPQYSYGYDIQDALTGDSKNHIETRSGDVVQGSYSLVDPDGTRRIVEYTADPVNGFNAVVHREPLAVKAVAAAPVAYAAPVAKIAAPFVHSKAFLG